MFLFNKYNPKRKWRNYLLGLGILACTIIVSELENKNNVVNQDCIPCQNEQIAAGDFCWNLFGVWNQCKPRGCRWFWKKCRYNTKDGSEVTE